MRQEVEGRMDDEHDNEMEQRRAEAWAEYTRGTFSESDRKIFDYAFERGWSAYIEKSFEDFKRNRELGQRARKAVSRQ